MAKSAAASNVTPATTNTGAAAPTDSPDNLKGYVDPCADQIQIVVIDGGWVIVGYCNLFKAEGHPDELHCFKSAVIRRWGTTEGLGEIAFNGPTKETILDKCGIVRVPYKSVTMRLDTVQSKWVPKL